LIILKQTNEELLSEKEKNKIETSMFIDVKNEITHLGNCLTEIIQEKLILQKQIEQKDIYENQILKEK